MKQTWTRSICVLLSRFVLALLLLLHPVLAQDSDGYEFSKPLSPLHIKQLSSTGIDTYISIESESQNGRCLRRSVRLLLESHLDTSSKWILTLGSWDSIRIHITDPVTGRPITPPQRSGHSVRGNHKSSRALIPYPTAAHLRMGLQNQAVIELPPGKPVETRIDFSQSSGLPVYESMALIPAGGVRTISHLPLIMSQMFFLGAILMLLLYHGMLYVTTRSKAYLFSTLYLAAIILHTLDYAGILSEWVFINSPGLRPVFKLLADNGIAIFYMFLFRAFTRTDQLEVKWDRRITWSIWAIMAYIPIGLCWIALNGNLIQVMVISITASLIPIVMIIWVAPIILRTQSPPSLYFLLGTACLILGHLINALFIIWGWEERNIFSYFDRIQFMQAGIFLQVIFFSVGLGYYNRQTEKEGKEARELNVLKSRFIANLSHEFRTPLTLILNPVSFLLDRELPTEVRDQLSLVRHHANRLLALINQLLDLSKLEAGKINLHVQAHDLIPFLIRQISAFESIAESRGIRISFSSDESNCKAWVDIEKLEKVMTNLLYNAIKFTPQSGSIQVRLKQGRTTIFIQVQDNGPGIPPSALPHVFERFYQVESPFDGKPEGTGIGLAYSRELIEMHKGGIQVLESNPETGTVFQVSLLRGKSHFSREQLVPRDNSEPKSQAKALEVQPLFIRENQQLNTVPLNGAAGLPRILIVEDNQDLQTHMQLVLQEEYEVQVAEDGESGFRICIHDIPDLVISDIMMPKMDGYTLCNKLKSDHRTNHIPVILLTALADTTDKIQGLDTGADAYLVKPFDLHELKAQIRNLIQQRKALQFIHNSRLFPASQTETSTQESASSEAANHMLRILASNYSDPNFKVEQFAKKMNITRRQLGRKSQALFDKPPGELLREFRLQQAANLIESESGSITEISLMVGFRNPAHFASSFRELFGTNPSSYSSRSKRD